jgi:ABC-type ATPase with predicted acetyltransferase domain
LDSHELTCTEVKYSFFLPIVFCQNSISKGETVGLVYWDAYEKTPEELRITKLRRIYNKSDNKFSYNIRCETFAKPTSRSLVVAEAFGLGIDETQKFQVLNVELTICSQDIVYNTVDSGSGKSVLLRVIRADLGEEAIDLTEVQVDLDKPLIETVGATVEQALELLSKVGLNDAFLFLRTYSQLSDGQVSISRKKTISI